MDADDEPTSGWVHPDDRLWRHPSEVARAMPAVASPRPARTGTTTWAVAGVVGMISALLTAGLIAAAGGFTTREVPVRSAEIINRALPVQNTDLTSVVEVAERIRPSIVEVKVDPGTARSSAGSGVVFRSDGHVLTNRHVIEGASMVKVVAADGREHTAKVIGSDADTDVAVLKVDAAMPVAVLGTANQLRVGQQAIAIGSPLGLVGGPSVTVGVVSALARTVEGRDGPPLLDMIQTDAPISPGSSGGALLDSAGNVIGITTAIAVTEVGAEGLGFATPIDVARDVAEQLLTTGKVVHVWLGVRGEDVDPATASTLGVVGGAMVREVSTDSPAAVAGIKERDVIVEVNGKSVASMAQIVLSLRDKKVGDTVELTLRRAGAERTVTAKLMERPAKI